MNAEASRAPEFNDNVRMLLVAKHSRYLNYFLSFGAGPHEQPGDPALGRESYWRQR